MLKVSGADVSEGPLEEMGIHSSIHLWMCEIIRVMVKDFTLPNVSRMADIITLIRLHS